MNSLSVRVFDTILDSNKRKDTVSRGGSLYWKEFCNASGWGFSHERVHSSVDFNFFLSKKIHEDVIIINSHGSDEGIWVSNGDVIVPDDVVELNEKNHGKIWIFSSCLIGSNPKLCDGFLSKFNAKKLFAYLHVMEDRFCYLNESILLTLMQEKSSFGKRDFESFQENTAFMKNLNAKGVKKHPMVMFE